MPSMQNDQTLEVRETPKNPKSSRTFVATPKSFSQRNCPSSVLLHIFNGADGNQRRRCENISILQRQPFHIKTSSASAWGKANGKVPKMNMIKHFYFYQVLLVNASVSSKWFLSMSGGRVLLKTSWELGVVLLPARRQFTSPHHAGIRSICCIYETAESRESKLWDN